MWRNCEILKIPMIRMKNDEPFLVSSLWLFLRKKISILSISFFLCFRFAVVYNTGYTCIQKHISSTHIYITCKKSTV